MIKNERQYRITKAQIERFENAVKGLRERRANKEINPLLLKMEEDAIRSQVEDLYKEVTEYEALRAGEIDLDRLQLFLDLPETLIRARIAKGFTQKDLAERLGLKEQQIQRYEATNYRTASLGKVMEIMRVLGIEKGKQSFAETDQFSLARLFERLKQVGLDEDFLLKRIVPFRLSSDVVSQTTATGSSAIALQLAGIVSKVFDWTVDALFGSAPLHLKPEAAGLGKFKVSKRVGKRYMNAYTVYAHYLSAAIVMAAPEPTPTIPVDPLQFRKAVERRFGDVTLETTLRFIWQLGIPVLPLRDSGAFYGACWRIRNRNVIVLKQKTKSQARWLFDLLHEFRHAGQHEDQETFSVVELEPTDAGRIGSDDEEQASRFAGDVMLSGQAEALVQSCVESARGSVERLKSVLPRIAEQSHAPVDALANYMAFRLSLQNINWWGAAENLQKLDVDPWIIARDVFLTSGLLERLNDFDRNLVVQALSDKED